MAASTEGVDGPKDGAGRDMSFDLVRRDIGFDATADTSGIPDSDSDELANGDVPNETVPQESAEVQDDVARNSPKTEQISHSSKVVDTASAPADGHEDNAPISDGSVKADSVEPDISVPSLEVPPTRIEVRLPSLPLDQRDDYEEVRSNIIEMVRREEFTDSGQACYYVDFTDGREEVVTHDDLISHQNGKAALLRFYNPEMEALGKRKRDDADEWQSEAVDPTSNGMDVDDDDQEPVNRRQAKRSRSARSLPTRGATGPSSRHHSLPSDEDEDDIAPKEIPQPRRSGRTRKAPVTVLEQGQDELQDDPASKDDEDFPNLITSDLPGSKKTRSKLLRVQTRRATRAPTRLKPSDSDVEFEAPRRSNRSTRNQLDMRDDALMGEDSFYVVEEKTPSAPKVISVREVFRPTDPESAFASTHLDSCHTCGGSKHMGQLIYCQGCSLTYHKNCLGYRSGREHMVTKIGEEDFILQCKYCIGLYKKKDAHAPRYDMCQSCKGPGKACAAFSQKKTNRQEEKLREQNGGTDPITPVSSDLVDNPELVLFRCVSCHRGWHFEHLPAIGNETVATDVRSERLKDYSIDWQCNECSSAKHKPHHIVAWRPVPEKRPSASSQVGVPSFLDFDEDSKEYLIKWDGTSYFHCSWKPSAWAFGVLAPASRVAFAKRDAERSQLHYSEKDAIPEEYLIPDIILNLKMDSSAYVRSKRKEDDLNQASKIRKMLVKFQGLGYDEVVWDTPPKQSDGDAIYSAFLSAFYDYLEGKFFESQPYSRIRDRIRAYKAADFEEVDTQPAGLQRGKLMSYQIEGLNWLLENYHSNKSVVLADEMGLGKTVQVVSLVASLVQDKPRCWPFLIVVPNATCPNWRREFKQWTPDLRVVAYYGGRASQELAYKYELFPQGSNDMKAHVVIMSYDSAADPQTKTLFRNIHWAGLVVDEGQRLKNDQNLLYSALQSMKIPFRLLLTGTPLQNNKRELFNLLQFIDESQDASKLDIEYEVLDKKTLPKLHEKIRPYFLRRTKAGVLKFLPPMAQIILPVTMTVLQEKLSKSIMAKNPQLIKSMFANSKMNKTERGSLSNILMQLRKCLCHPFVYSDAIEERHHDQTTLHRNLVEASAKLILLQTMLPKLKERGHRVLIFSQFLQQLNIVEDFLTGLGYGFRRLDGQVSSLEKQRRIDAFNAPGSELFAFLLSTRAGGVGINLATADTVIIMDPDFNPHQDIQALSRAHRIGQKQKVLCFQLVTKDSVEERIMQIGRKKMALDHALIESMDDDDLAGDDLESILKHGAQALFNDHYHKEVIHYDSASVDKLLDRSQMEKTETTEDGSGDTQYSYAKVWANEKSAFEDGLEMGEDEAPEPINSSVWDSILAEREEEARKEAERNQEVLGRGVRRRTAAGSYKPHGGVPDGLEAELDSSEDYSGAESAEDSVDDSAGPGKGKRRKTTPSPAKKTPTTTPIKKQTKNTINSQSQQTPKAKPQPPSKRKTSKPNPTNVRGAKPSTPTPTPKKKSVPENTAQKERKKSTGQKSSKGQDRTGPPTGLATPAPTPPAARRPKQLSAAGPGSPILEATSETLDNM